eukprot:gnl/TRDRNA2_/TRDRNA2_173267_c0_seq1.p1 gnl/TRDRNA2_/TRDRNA2_173267_c0~~gnl/TRDRNA2_/TRDRNA2_173267_c0_seq1.p1  ORF type:complete len:400 (+),score=79.54 gnl/TRDRNA2_/TRDRNA2_173267_c0_seq1:107-1306(+)
MPAMLRIAGLCLVLFTNVAGGTFQSFIQKHGRSYKDGSSEYKLRRALFDARLKEIEEHNARPDRLYDKGINHLIDWTDAELAQLRGYRPTARPAQRSGGISSRSVSFLQKSKSAKDLPQAVSWLHLNTTKDVKDQGACGSCWAIATATVLRGHSQIYGTERTFSAQELLSCTPNEDHCGGTGGCEGATAELGFDYINKHGLATDEQAPYLAENGKCQTAGKQSLVELGSRRGVEIQAVGVRLGAVHGSGGLSFGMTGWQRLEENKYAPLVNAVVERGPVAVSVAASGWSFYSGGVFDDCGKDVVIDHSVTLVGFGNDNKAKAKYWLIQNSWSPSWGEHGFIRLLRNEKDETEHCGIDNRPQDGTGCAGGPAKVTVCGQCGILYDSTVPIFKSHVATTSM